MPEKFTKDQVIELVRKMARRTEENGATAAEAAQAAAMIKHLLAQYELSEFDVEAVDFDNEEGHDVVEEIHKSDYTKVPAWSSHMADCIARGMDCKMLYRQGRGGIKAKVFFIGMELDALAARMMYVHLGNEMWYECERQITRKGISDRKGYRESFLYEAFEIIEERLIEKREQMKTEMSKYGALIIFKEKKIDAYLEREHPNIRTSTRNTRWNGQGAADGGEAGRNASIDDKIAGERRRIQ